MIWPLMEDLEQRQLLSVSVPSGSMPSADGDLAEMATMQAAKVAAKVANVLGNYSSKVSFGEEPGQMVLQITSQKGSKVAGRLYSSEWGGFEVAVAGTVDVKGKLVLSGRNATLTLKKLTLQVGPKGATLQGSCSLVQMRILVSSTIHFGKLRKAPPKPAPAKAPAIVGSYRGYAYDEDGSKSGKTMTITKQDGGRIWGNADGSPLTGVVLKDGRFRVIVREEDGYTDVTGKVARNGSMEGDWEYKGNDGTGSGTFEFRRI